MKLTWIKIHFLKAHKGTPIQNDQEQGSVNTVCRRLYSLIYTLFSLAMRPCVGLLAALCSSIFRAQKQSSVKFSYIFLRKTGKISKSFSHILANHANLKINCILTCHWISGGGERVGGLRLFSFLVVQVCFSGAFRTTHLRHQSQVSNYAPHS